MKFRFPILIAALLLPQAARADQVEEVPRGTPDIPALPEDLFRLPPGIWAFAKELWKGDDPCTADECEGGYTSGDVVVSVLRRKTQVRVVAGFRGCVSVSWNDYEVGKKASSGDTKAIAKQISGPSERLPNIARFRRHPLPRSTLANFSRPKCKPRNS